MTLIKRNPVFPSTKSLLENFWGGDSLFNDEFFRKDWIPAVNVKDNDKSYEIELAAPGLKKEDFTVKIVNDVLTISSEKKNEREEKKDNYTRKEFNYSSFSRSFSLPANINENGISAKYENGVLKLTLAKNNNKTGKGKEVKIS